MNPNRFFVGTIPMIFLMTLAIAPSMNGQVGRSMGITDVNTVAEKGLLGMPHMTAAIVKTILSRRPFASITDLHALLRGQGLTEAEATEFYAKAFVHVNLNTATRDEIILIPGAGARMAREFAEYRPWTTWAQFDKEIGKYVGAAETARLAQYCFIPINLNTASDADLQTIPGAGPRIIHELKEYRPWKNKEHFENEIAKYVGATETARLWRYVVIQ